jgi:hypothetical protein
MRHGRQGGHRVVGSDCPAQEISQTKKKKQPGKVGQHREAVATTVPGQEKSRGRREEAVVVVASHSRSNK